ncbi:polyprenyl synthetase family protein [Streptomyces sp. TRM43335]|uniref:Polyprenyl synthetase family protein n=2 Tax=Streptomyces taklimakanensis TaxID=2569853 RepID=A0A6G2B6I5_9ACTN|nr:polyprenyl synthetase family protein [Streptomyces taklimakanensis]
MRQQAAEPAVVPATPAPAHPAPAPRTRAGDGAPRPPHPAEGPRGASPPDPVADPDRDVASAVEAVLDDYLTRRREDAARTSDRFAADIADCLIDLVRRGGKRLRPAFLWWGWRTAGGRPGDGEAEAVLHAAAALELVQACALVHDDLMDDSPSRRGAPAAHVALADLHRAGGLRGDPAVFGASAALLTGDLALVWAEDLWDEASPSPEARRRTRPVWRAMRTEMVAGQYLDLHGQASGAPSPSSSLRVAHLKSGLYTVERPLHLGAALADAGPRVTAALRRAGRSAGTAFQLRDDLLDVFGDPARTGKPAGEDVRRGKSTYLMAVGLRLARGRGRERRAARELLDRALGDPVLGHGEVERVRAVLTELGARAAVERHIAELAQDALAALEELGQPAGPNLPAGSEDAPVRRLASLVRAVLGDTPDALAAPVTAPVR